MEAFVTQFSFLLLPGFHSLGSKEGTDHMESDGVRREKTQVSLEKTKSVTLMRDVFQISSLIKCLTGTIPAYSHSATQAPHKLQDT